MSNYFTKLLLLPGDKTKKNYLCTTDIQRGDKVLGTILTGNNVYVSEKEQGFYKKENIHYISLDEAKMMGAYKIIKQCK